MPKDTQETLTATVDANHLRKTLKMANLVVEKYNSIPVLRTVKISFGTQSTITASDLDLRLELDIVAEAETPFDLLIECKTLLDIAKHSQGPITFALAADTLTMAANGYKVTRRNLFDPTDFPAWTSNLDTPAKIELSFAEMQDLDKFTRFALSTEETRYYLNGAYWHSVDGKFSVVTTDGHRLAKFDFDHAYDGGNQIVPRKTLIVIAALTKGARISSDILTIHMGDKPNKDIAHQVHFVGPGFKLFSKCIDGTYPEYPKVMAGNVGIKSPKCTAKVTNAMIAKVPLDREFPHLNFYPETQSIKAKSHDYEFAVDCECTGEPFGFFGYYLRQMTAIKSPLVIRGTLPGNPFEVVSDDPRHTWILMPVRLR